MNYRTGTNIVKMTFDNGANLPVDLILQTNEFDKKKLEDLSTRISSVLLGANKGVSIDEFDIPENWYSFGFIDKLETVANHLSVFIGGFSVMPYMSVVKKMEI